MQPGIPSCFRDTSVSRRPGSFLGLSLKPSSRHKKAPQPSKDNAQDFLANCLYKSQAEIVGQYTPSHSHQVHWLQQFSACSLLPVAFWGSSLKQLWFLLFCVFETRFPLAQTGLKLTLSPEIEITLNSCSSSLCFSSVGITCHHAQLWNH